MRHGRGAALAVALVLLVALSVLALSGARLGAAELRLAQARELRLDVEQQAQSMLDLAQQAAATAPAELLRQSYPQDFAAGALELSVRDGDVSLPPLPGTGYSADKLAVIARRTEARVTRGYASQLAEGLAVLHAIDELATPTLPSGGDYAALSPVAGPPRLARVQLDGQPQWLVLFGCGNALCAARADTGALVWQGAHTELGTLAAAPAVLDSDADGAVDRAYLGDIAGRVWRADFSGPAPEWTLTQLARLPGRFYATPDLVQERDAQGTYAAVVIGGGDRTTSAPESVWLLEDRAETAGEDRELAPKWRATVPAGEKVLGSPLTVAHRVWFASYDAGADIGVLHALSLASGAELPAPTLELDGLPPPLRWAGHAVGRAGCTVSLQLGAQSFEAPGCTRFRSWWQRGE